VVGRGEAAGVRARHSPGRATDREVVVVAAVLDAGSEEATAHRLGLSHSTVKHHLANARSKVGAETTAQLVWILAPRLPEPRRRRPIGPCHHALSHDCGPFGGVE
jgi:DNA-binding CsgD family transcriptional regulator